MSRRCVPGNRRSGSSSSHKVSAPCLAPRSQSPLGFASEELCATVADSPPCSARRIR